MSSSEKVLGSFSKGTAGSVSINFSISGGVHCDTGCIHHPQSTADGATGACYAVRTENRPDRAQLLSKLARHEVTPPALVCGRALSRTRGLVSCTKGCEVTTGRSEAQDGDDGPRVHRVPCSGRKRPPPVRSGPHEQGQMRQLHRVCAAAHRYRLPVALTR